MSLIRRTLPTWPTLTDFFDDDWGRDWLLKENGSPSVNVVDKDNNYEIEVAAPEIRACMSDCPDEGIKKPDTVCQAIEREVE